MYNKTEVKREERVGFKLKCSLCIYQKRDESKGKGDAAG